MNSLLIALIAFTCAFGGAVVGSLLRGVVPASHLSRESADVIKVGSGLIGTVAALVLGLLVASATTEFNEEQSALQQLATDFILVDRALGHYGPEANDARARLRELVATLVEGQAPRDPARSTRLKSREAGTVGQAMFDAIQKLSPHTEAQKVLQTQTIQVCFELAKTRWMLGDVGDCSIPTPFLVVLMFWLALLFATFGLLAPRNATVMVVIFVCALSVAGAIFLILDLDQPFDGLIQVSSEPLRNALTELGR